uniref:Phospholipase A2 n=1 Tax=Naja naja TaxID=35670 RepID=A0A8C6VCF4_NAJNA
INYQFLLFPAVDSASHCYVTLHLPTASREIFKTQTVRNSYYPVWNETFYFRIQTKIKNILQLEVCKTDPETKCDIQLIVLFDLSKLQSGSPFLEKFSLKPKVRGKKLFSLIWLFLCPRSQNLDVRLGYELCPDEQDFLRKRKKVVADALYKLFNLGEELQEDEVPVIAVLATGGGIRAMISLYAHLSAFQKLNLLDCITYITSASGSTWTLTNLYFHMDWSHQSFEDHIHNIKKQLLKNKNNAISNEKLKQYHKELSKRIKAGHLSSFTALWALVQEAFFHNGTNTSKLSDQQQALNQGQNPFPIYTAINVKQENIKTFDFREWVEFNPYEVGLLKYGAQIRSEDFDSEFFMGKAVKKIPESRICYMEGIWTNIFSPNLLDCLYWATSTEEFWKRWVKDMSIKHENYSSNDYPATVYKPPSYPYGKLCEIFNDILTDRPLRGENYNFLQGFDFDKDYLHQKEFMTWSDTEFDTSSNKLTPNTKSLCLIDVGFFMNNSGVSLLKPERNKYFHDYFPFECLCMMAEYCEIQGIPFPKVNVSEKDRKNMKECYVFSDEDNPKAPIVLCFPLVCGTFKEYSAPGRFINMANLRCVEFNSQNSRASMFIHLISSSYKFLIHLISSCGAELRNLVFICRIKLLGSGKGCTRTCSGLERSGLANVIWTEFDPVSEDEVDRIMRGLSSTTCLLDPCPSWLGYASREVTCGWLWAVVNASLREGLFPAALKEAVVRPLLKKPALDPAVLNNFRPVSNLRFLANVLKCGGPAIATFPGGSGLPGFVPIGLPTRVQHGDSIGRAD